MMRKRLIEKRLNPSIKQHTGMCMTILMQHPLEIRMEARTVEAI
jgi:hypothetical protein